MLQKSLIILTVELFHRFYCNTIHMFFFSVLVGRLEEKPIMESWCLPTRYLNSRESYKLLRDEPYKFTRMWVR